MNKDQEHDEADERAALEAELRASADVPDDALDVASLALAFARLDGPARDVEPYRAHLNELAAAAKAATLRLGPANADLIAEVLANVVAGQFSYQGDSEAYDDLKNADLMQVIDRRRGLPVAIGIIYLHVAAKLELDLVGLNFPGHFVMRLTVGGEATIIDPFNRGERLSTADLLALLRSIEGPDARLTPEIYAAVSPRDILLRLQNNILSRALRAGELDRARDIVSRMIWLAPLRAGLQFELGRLEVHAGHMGAAAEAFELCRRMAVDEGEMRVAQMAEEALRRLKTKLN